MQVKVLVISKRMKVKSIFPVNLDSVATRWTVKGRTITIETLDGKIAEFQRKRFCKLKFYDIEFNKSEELTNEEN